MRLSADAVASRVQERLQTVYFIFGAEPLLIEESCDAIRQAAREQGYDERLVYTIDARFKFDELAELGAAQSLFSMRRIVEFRIAGGRLGDIMGKLDDLLADPPPDTLFIIVAGTVDRRSQKTKWFKRVDDIAVTIDCPVVPPERMVSWLNARLQKRGIRAEPGVAERMAWFLEGNLLAAAQEIDRLKLLHGEGTLDAGAVEKSLSDHARFTVFGLIDCLIEGKVERALRVLDGLKREGTEPVIVLITLSREVRNLANVASDVASGMSQSRAFQKHRVWQSKTRMYAQALKRFDARGWQDILYQVARADRILKGREARVAGSDVWDEFERLTLLVCGVGAVALQASA